MENTELETAVKVSDDKTSENEQLSQPSENEQLNKIKAELEKYKSIAERKTKQLENLKSSLNTTEDVVNNSTNVEQVVSTPLPQEENKSELEQVKEQLFRVQHPEITNEDMDVLKSIGGNSLEEKFNNQAFKSYMEQQNTIRENANATISKESGAIFSADAGLEKSWGDAIRKTDNCVYDFTKIKELGKLKLEKFLKDNNLN